MAIKGINTNNSVLNLMLTKKLYVSVGFLFLIIQTAFADSPLTSTEFYKAYDNQDIVVLAANSEGKLTNELIEYLLVQENPVAIKLAVINALGWELNKKKNHQKFINDLIKKKKYTGIDDFKEKGNAQELICYAYLMAMDNYLNPKESYRFALSACKKEPKSLFINLITGLINAQMILVDKGDWCDVFQATNRVIKNKELVMDLNTTAVNLVFSYMNNYEKHCQ